MNITQRIKKLLQEAELYHSQSLLVEAKEKYENAAKLFQSNRQLKGQKKMRSAILKKISSLDNTIKRITNTSESPEVSEKVQDLIKKLFSFSSDHGEDTADLEGAIALAKFGQIERALLEFGELLKKDSIRVAAAKNILRCHISLSSLDNALDQYQQWLDRDLFTPEQLGNIRSFLDGILDKKGMDKNILQGKGDEVQADIVLADEIDENGVFEDEISGGEIPEDEILDISSVGIPIDKGPQKGRIVELDVSFQSGNKLSLIVSGKEEALIENLKAGKKLVDIQFFSPIAIFNGSGIISSNTQIKSGPKQGYYCLDMKVTNI